MRVVLVNQFYPPDVAPTGRYLHDLAEALTGHGHEVVVVSSRLSYRQAVSLTGKAFGYVRFLIQAWWTILRVRRDTDLIVTLTTPPWIGLITSLAAGRRCCRVHWIMDLYPQVLAAHQLVRKESRGYRFLAALSRWEWRHADLLVMPGFAMAEKVQEAEPSLSASKIEVLPLWTLDQLQPWPETEVNSLRQARRWTPEDTVLMYTGNMGLGHDVKIFLEAAQRGSEAGRWRLAFSGWGQRMTEVERFIQQNPEMPVELLTPVAVARLGEHLGSADIHLASMQSGWSGLIVPCKLQAAFAVKRPVLFVGPGDSDPARWIQESGGGWVVAEGDVDGLLNAVRACCDPAERRRRGEAAYRFAQVHFDRKTNVEGLIRALEKVFSKAGKLTGRGAS